MGKAHLTLTGSPVQLTFTGLILAHCRRCIPVIFGIRILQVNSPRSLEVGTVRYLVVRHVYIQDTKHISDFDCVRGDLLNKIKHIPTYYCTVIELKNRNK